MRWCFFSPSDKSRDVLAGDTRSTGGAEAQVAYLAAALARKGHEVSLIYGEGEATLATEVIAGVTCVDAVPTWQPSALASFWQTLRKLAPNVIYARLPSDFLWMIRLYSRQAGAKFIYALASPMHCNPWTAYDYNRWFHAPVFALGLHGADVIVVQHEHQVPLMSPSLQRRTAHVPNLVRFFGDQPRPIEQTRYDAVWIGMIRPEKQLERFLDLAAALPELQFAVVGGFDSQHHAKGRAELEQRMLSLPNLTFLGPQQAEAIQMMLTLSKVLVNTSPAEGFPNTMLEAWSLGVPVVALSVDPGGVMQKEGIGFLSGSLAGLLHDVSVLASNSELNLQLGSRGLEYVRRNHSLEAVYASLIKTLPALVPADPMIQAS